MPRRRRWWLLAIAVLLTAAAAYGNYALLAGQDERVDVLVLVRDVDWGERISEGDLGIAHTAPDPRLASILAEDRTEVVGRTVRSTLSAGTVLTPAQLTEQSVPGPNELLIGLPVKPGNLPARGLSAGDLVQASPVPAGAGTGQTSTDTGEPFRARVVGVGQPDSTGAITVDVVLDDDAANAATDAAAGQVVLIQLGPGA